MILLRFFQNRTTEVRAKSGKRVIGNWGRTRFADSSVKRKRFRLPLGANKSGVFTIIGFPAMFFSLPSRNDTCPIDDSEHGFAFSYKSVNPYLRLIASSADFWPNDDCAVHPEGSDRQSEPLVPIISGMARKEHLMTTVTIRLGDVMATQARREHLAQTNPEAIALGQQTERALTERHGHEAWKQRMEETWQGHLQTLQQCVCELLVKNQQLRMALMAANEPQRRPIQERSKCSLG
jgi:hypothetical protein